MAWGRRALPSFSNCSVCAGRSSSKERTSRTSPPRRSLLAPRGAARRRRRVGDRSGQGVSRKAEWAGRSTFASSSSDCRPRPPPRARAGKEAILLARCHSARARHCWRQTRYIFPMFPMPPRNEGKQRTNISPCMSRAPPWGLRPNRKVRGRPRPLDSSSGAAEAG
jgi:hypothetical protein